MKKRSRKNLADEKRELYKIGGGQFQHRPDKNTGRLATLMGQSATGLENYVDSDAIVTYEQEPEYLDESMQSCTVEHLDAASEAKEHDARADWSSWNPTLLRSKPNEKLATKREKKKETSDAHQIFWMEENQRAAERHTWAKKKNELELKEAEMKLEILRLDVQLKTNKIKNKIK
ncbi:uncharacterized protein LOC118734805 [Rhagoletis pomonella]|uniref:uncharacterized protein LOC118734805 n=1 Tax=Rhagoletis pomonella TaxID=28610 RepID=UPI00177AAE52|nr:uncharacterized protein LOC118734805 [Rhagoletis pomonella]